MANLNPVVSTIFYSVLLFTVQACCLGNYKCRADDNGVSFRILDRINGKDLVFGTGSIYDKDSIRFFSLNGIDTINHHYGAGPNPNPGQDSLLFVDFDYRNYETVFMKLGGLDTDTLKLTYPLVDASPCCPDYNAVQPVSNNGGNLSISAGGIFVIHK